MYRRAIFTYEKERKDNGACYSRSQRIQLEVALHPMFLIMQEMVKSFGLFIVVRVLLRDSFFVIYN